MYCIYYLLRGPHSPQSCTQENLIRKFYLQAAKIEAGELKQQLVCLLWIEMVVVVRNVKITQHQDPELYIRALCQDTWLVTRGTCRICARGRGELQLCARTRVMGPRELELAAGV